MAWTFTLTDNKLAIDDGIGGYWNTSSAGTVRLYNTDNFEMSVAGTKIYFSFADIGEINSEVPEDAADALAKLLAALPVGGDTGVFA